jgi:hypothetical protein
MLILRLVLVSNKREYCVCCVFVDEYKIVITFPSVITSSFSSITLFLDCLIYCTLDDKNQQ